MSTSATRVAAFSQGPASFIDHTLLKPNATKDEIDRLCEEAKRFGFKSVCVNPCWVKRCVELLKDSQVLVCTVVGFPLGANHAQVKAYETTVALEDGATEIDMVMNVGHYLSDPDNGKQTLETDVGAVIAQLKRGTQTIPLKVIIETSLLNSDQIHQVSRILSSIEGVSFVKTSTGFSGPGARVEDLKIIKSIIHHHQAVKASGGIKTFEDCLKMVEAGADRIGSSSGVKILQEWSTQLST